jgi:hypothetical protein
MSEITLSAKEYDRLIRWISSLPKTPVSIKIKQGGNNGIGTTKASFVFFDYGDDTGEWKQITDYSEW